MVVAMMFVVTGDDVRPADAARRGDRGQDGVLSDDIRAEKGPARQLIDAVRGSHWPHP